MKPQNVYGEIWGLKPQNVYGGVVFAVVSHTSIPKASPARGEAFGIIVYEKHSNTPPRPTPHPTNLKVLLVRLGAMG